MMGNMNSMNVFEKNIKNSMIDDDPRRHFFFWWKEKDVYLSLDFKASKQNKY